MRKGRRARRDGLARKGAFMSAARSPTRISAFRLMLAEVLLLAGLRARAESPGDRFEARDVEIALHARRALSLDAEVDKLRLGVTVRGGEATVWGVAPTWELAEKALRIVEKVP